MEQEKGNFKGMLFGGFNRHDVIDYIEELAAERNSLSRENEELRERIEELEDRLLREPTDIIFSEDKPKKEETCIEPSELLVCKVRLKRRDKKSVRCKKYLKARGGRAAGF